MTSQNDIRPRIREVFATALDRPIGPDENVVQTSEVAWDSVKHIEIIFMIEEALGVTFDPAEFAEMTSLDECVVLASRRLAAAA